MSDEIYQSMIQPRGAEYRSSQIKSWSHYREPIDQAPDRLSGNSRVWGDASPEVQSRVIDALIESSRRSGLNPRETAYVLATARQESGFNPDAAAGTTSAAGIGQFVDDTGRAYGLNNGNRFDVNAQSDALVAHFIDNRNLARTRGQGEEYVYAYHHDGPSLAYGGLGLSRREIMPRLDEYERFVNQRLGREQTNAPTQQERQQTTSTTQQTPNRTQPSDALADGVLQSGERGPAVEAAQRALARLGIKGEDGQPLQADGRFGPNTRAAVSEFQLFNGIPATGKIDQPTQSALNEAVKRVPEQGPNALADGLLRQGERGGDVKGLQESLNRLNIRDANGNRLAEDSSFGERTREAVENFQRANGLKVDGIAGPRTLETIGNKLPEERVTVERAEVTGVLLVTDARHSNNALYKAISDQLPAGTKPEVAANVTLQAVQNGITSPEKLQSVTVQDGSAYVMGTTSGDRAKVDMNGPTPTLEESSGQMSRQADQQQVSQQQQQQTRTAILQ